MPELQIFASLLSLIVFLRLLPRLISSFFVGNSRAVRRLVRREAMRYAGTKTRREILAQFAATGEAGGACFAVMISCIPLGQKINQAAAFLLAIFASVIFALIRYSKLSKRMNQSKGP